MHIFIFIFLEPLYYIDTEIRISLLSTGFHDFILNLKSERTEIINETISLRPGFAQLISSMQIHLFCQPLQTKAGNFPSSYKF